MTYAEATALALAGKTVMRPKWRNFALSSRPARGVGSRGPKPTRRVLVYVNDFGDAGDTYRPVNGDEAATDWMERPS